MRLLLLPVLAASLLPAQTPAFDRAKFEAYVRHYMLWDPRIQITLVGPKPSTALPGFDEVTVRGTLGKASQDVAFYLSRDGQTVVRGAVLKLNQSPFQDDLARLKTEGHPSFGTPGAPVVLVVFSDFQCPLCRDEAKMLRDNVAKAYPKEVRVYFRDFPLEAIHPWAKPAAMAGRCVFRQAPMKFWDFHDWIFDQQANINAENLRAKVTEWGGTAGVETQQLQRCLETEATRGEVERSSAEARDLGLNATPTLFVNGRKLTGKMEWPQLKAIIDFELVRQKETGIGGEAACCEVKLPVPGQN